MSLINVCGLTSYTKFLFLVFVLVVYWDVNLFWVRVAHSVKPSPPEFFLVHCIWWWFFFKPMICSVLYMNFYMENLSCCCFLKTGHIIILDCVFIFLIIITPCALRLHGFITMIKIWMRFFSYCTVVTVEAASWTHTERDALYESQFYFSWICRLLDFALTLWHYYYFRSAHVALHTLYSQSLVEDVNNCSSGGVNTHLNEDIVKFPEKEH